MYLKTIEGYYVNTDHISSMLPNGKTWIVITSADERYSITAAEGEGIVRIKKAEVKTNGNKDTKKRSNSKKKV